MSRRIAIWFLFTTLSAVGFGTAGPEAVSEDHNDFATSMILDLPGVTEDFPQVDYYLAEDFDGPSFPPAGWYNYSTHPNGYWTWESNYSDFAGGTSPEAMVEYAYWASGVDYQISFITPSVDTSDAAHLFLQFKHHAYIDEYAAGHEFYIRATADGSNWVDITPWTNPAWYYYSNIGPETVTLNISDFIGPSTQVHFMIWVPYSANNIQYWAVDEVRIFKPPIRPRWKVRPYDPQ